MCLSKYRAKHWQLFMVSIKRGLKCEQISIDPNIPI